MKFIIERSRVFFSNYSPYEKAASVLVTVLVFLLPLFFIPGLSLSLQFTKSILIASVVFLGLIFYIVAQLQKRQIDLPRNPVLLMLWLVPFVYLASTIFSGNIKVSVFGSHLNVDTLSFIVLMTVATSLVVMLVKSQQRIVQIYVALFASFGVLALYHLLRIVFGGDFLTFGVFTTSTASPVGSWNDLAIFSGLIAILSLILITTRLLSKRVTSLFKGSLVVALFFLVLINFETVWWVVGFFALAAFVYSIISGTNEEGERRGMSGTSLIVLVLSLIVLFFGNGIGGYLSEKFNTQYFDVRPSWESTIEIGKTVYTDRTLFGSGPNTFEKEWLLNKPAGINNTLFWNVNFNTGIGFIPTSFITTGLLGIIAWMLFLLTFLFVGFKALILRGGEDKFSYHVILASFLSAAYLWLLLIMSAPSAAIIGLTFVFTGIFAASLRHQSRQFSIVFSENPRLGFIAVFILTIVFLGSIAGLFSLSQKYTAAISHEQGVRLATTDLPLAIEKIKKATLLDNNDQYFRSLTEAHIIELNQLFTESDKPADELRAQFQAIVGNAVGSAQAALEIDETNYRNWSELGRVYQVIASLDIEGAYQNAVAAYDGALKYNPEDPSLYLARAELEFTVNDNKLGKEYIGKALQKKNNYSAAIFLLTQVQIEEGNVTDAIVSAEALTLIDPNNATGYFQLGLLRYNSNDNRGAIGALERAVDINPSYSNARYFLGLAYFNADRIEDSLEQFMEVQKRNPENNDIAVIIDNLQTGKNPIGGRIDNLPISDE